MFHHEPIMLVWDVNISHLLPGLSFHPFQWNRATSLSLTAGQTGTWPDLPSADFLILHHSSCQENTSLGSLLGRPYYADPAPMCLHNSIIMRCSDTVLVKKKKHKHLKLVSVALTEVIIQGELVIIPYLHNQSWRNPELCFVKVPEVFLIERNTTNICYRTMSKH